MKKIAELLSKMGIEVDNEIEMGRSGSVNKDIAKLEIQRFAGNKPGVRRITGVTYSAKGNKTSYLSSGYLSYEESVSGGGNGSRTFDLECDCVYQATGVLHSSSRIREHIFFVTNQGVVELDDDAENEILQELFQGDYSAIDMEKKKYRENEERARYILKAAQEERAEVKSITIDGIVAKPEFSALPNIHELVYSNAFASKGDDEFVIELSLPTHFVVTTPVFSKAQSGEEAVDLAKRTIAERQESIKRAEDTSVGLPKLSGSEKQIAWAIQIRANVLSKNPTNSVLKKATTAKYWIENRNQFQ